MNRPHIEACAALVAGRSARGVVLCACGEDAPLAGYDYCGPCLAEFYLDNPDEFDAAVEAPGELSAEERAVHERVADERLRRLGLDPVSSAPAGENAGAAGANAEAAPSPADLRAPSSSAIPAGPAISPEQAAASLVTWYGASRAAAIAAEQKTLHPEYSAPRCFYDEVERCIERGVAMRGAA